MKTNWIKERRKQLDITQEDLLARLSADGFPFTGATISNWETGRHMPPLDNPFFVSALASALKMTVLGVFVAAGYDIKNEYSPHALKGADLIEKMPPHQRETAVGILEQLAKARI